MPKRKLRQRHAAPAASRSPRQAGLQAFRQNDYAAAIQQWSQLPLDQETAARAALAEAHFRRALVGGRSLPEAVADLRRAVELAPGEGRFWYHLGLALHRAGQRAEAETAYARTAELSPARRLLGYVRGLAEIEQRPATPLAGLPWLTPPEREALAPIAALLRGEPAAARQAQGGLTGDQVRAAELWVALASLADGDTQQALSRLAALKGQKLRPGVEAVRAWYHGLTALAAGDHEAALKEWREVARRPGPALPRLRPAVAALLQTQVLTLLAAGHASQAREQARQGLALAPGEPSLQTGALVAESRLANQAAEAGDWAAAGACWSAMRTALEQQRELGPLPPVLRNLAIACELQEQWEPAAEAWAELLRAVPKRLPKQTPPGWGAIPLDQQRTWLRRRIVANYQKAGKPEAAIHYYKQAIKAAPADLDLRLELAAALLANEQDIAARNEAQRILERQPEHTGAHLLLAQMHQAREEWYAAEQSLRRVLAIEPGHAAARRGVLTAMWEQGVYFFNRGQFHEARQIYQEALALAPDEPETLTLLADTELNLRNEAAARTHLAAALAVAKPEAYLSVLQTWLKHGHEAEARQVLAAAETAGLATPTFYIDAGLEICHSALPALMPALFGPPPKPNPAGQSRADWGRQLIDRGLAQAPDRAKALHHLITEFGMQQPGLAAQYARELVAVEPDVVDNYMALGLLQALNHEVAAAKETLRQAEKLARRQGHKDKAKEIEALRREVGSPMFGIFGPMLARMGAEDMDDLDDDEFFEDLL